MPGMARSSTVVVRSAADDDAPAINAIYNHYVATSPATFDVEPMSLRRRLTWLAERGDASHRALVARDQGHLLGFASSGSYMPRPAYDTTVLVSVYVHPEHTGSGIGAALYGELLDGLSRLDLHRAVAGITLPNPASVALHERFGFTQIGRFTEQGYKLGRYWDVAWFERPLP
jgi:phosphinothricin acetyltransferase